MKMIKKFMIDIKTPKAALYISYLSAAGGWVDKVTKGAHIKELQASLTVDTTRTIWSL